MKTNGDSVSKPILIIDTSDRAKSTVAILGKTGLVVIEENLPAQKLWCLIEEALKQARLAVSDLANMAVVVGPGSFTGLRVGVTVANILAWQLKLTLFEVSAPNLAAILAKPEILTTFNKVAQAKAVYD